MTMGVAALILAGLGQLALAGTILALARRRAAADAREKLDAAMARAALGPKRLQPAGGIGRHRRPPST